MYQNLKTEKKAIAMALHSIPYNISYDISCIFNLVNCRCRHHIFIVAIVALPANQSIVQLNYICLSLHAVTIYYSVEYRDRAFRVFGIGNYLSIALLLWDHLSVYQNNTPVKTKP